MFKKIRTSVFIIVSALIVVGCSAPITKQQHSGFLANYEGFVDSKKYDYTKVYRDDSFPREKLQTLNKIKVQPFEIWLQPENGSDLNPQQLVELSKYFSQRLQEKLSLFYQIVDSHSHDSLTIRGAFSGVELREPEVSVSDFVPIKLVLNTGNAAYLQVTDKRDVITRVSMEMEFLYGVEQKRIFALVSTKQLDATIANNGQDNVKAVEALLDDWVAQFVARLVEIKGE